MGVGVGCGCVGWGIIYQKYECGCGWVCKTVFWSLKTGFWSQETGWCVGVCVGVFFKDNCVGM